MWEVRETSPSAEISHGHTVVGPVAVPLTDLSIKLFRGLLVRAPGAGDATPNTDVVWIGRRAVTSDNNTGTGGVPLPPGSCIELPVDDPSHVYVVSQSAGQDVAWLGV